MKKGQRARRVTVKCNEPGCTTLVTCGVNTAYRAICPQCTTRKHNAYENERNAAARQGKVYQRVTSRTDACPICSHVFINGLCWCD